MEMRKKGKLIQRSYTLNDVNALKKKLKCESSRKREPFIDNEANDGSNLKIAMKASFFELAKERLFEDLKNHEDFIEVNDGIGAVAATSGGNDDAFVEYGMSVKFKKGDTIHKIKLTNYATTCAIMIQPMKESGSPFSDTKGKTLSLYFAKNFILIWSDQMIKDNIYND